MQYKWLFTSCFKVIIHHFSVKIILCIYMWKNCQLVLSSFTYSLACCYSFTYQCNEAFNFLDITTNICPCPFCQQNPWSFNHTLWNMQYLSCSLLTQEHKSFQYPQTWAYRLGSVTMQWRFLKICHAFRGNSSCEWCTLMYSHALTHQSRCIWLSGMR